MGMHHAGARKVEFDFSRTGKVAPVLEKARWLGLACVLTLVASVVAFVVATLPAPLMRNVAVPPAPPAEAR
jgi:hypothetical protein